ncbi:MAG TPA: hypothetical protein VLF90_02590 [Patescibacteria group bacterium]|nr:hypothetical protein [Patescibacteria group bacterium]
MKVIILYQANSEHRRQTEEFVHDFEHGHPNRKAEMVDVDSRDGAAQAALYDIVQYPSVLAMSDDGQLLKAWQGKFPLIDELAYYAQED